MANKLITAIMSIGHKEETSTTCNLFFLTYLKKAKKGMYKVKQLTSPLKPFCTIQHKPTLMLAQIKLLMHNNHLWNLCDLIAPTKSAFH